MFEEFFGLRTTPFTRDMPTESLFMTEQQSEIQARLEYAAQMQWFALLTGDCGSGKSTLIRKFAHKLDGNGYKVLYISDSKLTAQAFLQRTVGAARVFWQVLSRGRQTIIAS